MKKLIIPVILATFVIATGCNMEDRDADLRVQDTRTDARNDVSGDQLMNDWVNAWNEGNTEQIREMLADNVQLISGPHTLDGRDQVMNEWIERNMHQLSNMNVSTQRDGSSGELAYAIAEWDADVEGQTQQQRQQQDPQPGAEQDQARTETEQDPAVEGQQQQQYQQQFTGNQAAGNITVIWERTDDHARDHDRDREFDQDQTQTRTDQQRTDQQDQPMTDQPDQQQDRTQVQQDRADYDHRGWKITAIHIETLDEQGMQARTENRRNGVRAQTR